MRGEVVSFLQDHRSRSPLKASTCLSVMPNILVGVAVRLRIIVVTFVCGAIASLAASQESRDSQPSQVPDEDPVATLVAQLDIERYKATIKALTQFGDRRQGTPRNQAANNWIHAQFERYGCADVERMSYRYAPEAFVDPPLGMAGAAPRAIGGGRPFGTRVPMRANADPLRQADVALRALNSEPTEPGPRDQVWCTKVGASRPDRCTS